MTSSANAITIAIDAMVVQVQSQTAEIKVSDVTIEEINMCTICSSDKTIDAPFSPLFHSYRRDAKKDVQVSAIMMASSE